MESQPTDDVTSELERATGILRSALAEVCSTELSQANTGELLRVDEVLVLAGEATRKAVSLRRRSRRERGTATSRPPAPTPAGTPPLVTAGPEAPPHRVFLDAAGVSWDAFAVYPSSETMGKARLPEPYQRGWLSFDSGLERRRLSPIPPDWATMPEESLRAACARAEVAPKRLGGRPSGATEVLREGVRPSGASGGSSPEGTGAPTTPP